MNRGANLYLIGAVSGTTLIGAAIVTFVLLVSVQALEGWPISGLGLRGGGSESAVENARAVGRSPEAVRPGPSATPRRSPSVADAVGIRSSTDRSGNRRAGRGGGGLKSGATGTAAVSPASTTAVRGSSNPPSSVGPAPSPAPTEAAPATGSRPESGRDRGTGAVRAAADREKGGAAGAQREAETPPVTNGSSAGKPGPPAGRGRGRSRARARSTAAGPPGLTKAGPGRSGQHPPSSAGSAPALGKSP